MSQEELEQHLNQVINDLYTGFMSLAASVRDGNTEDTASNLEAMAGIICEHWPNCFESRSASAK